jgi:membrane protein DedA with SNARE-associated domain
METITHWISIHGFYAYPAIFGLMTLGIVFLPVPEETLMVSCGFLISKGTLNPVGVVLAAVAGSW